MACSSCPSPASCHCVVGESFICKRTACFAPQRCICGMIDAIGTGVTSRFGENRNLNLASTSKFCQTVIFFITIVFNCKKSLHWVFIGIASVISVIFPKKYITSIAIFHFKNVIVLIPIFMSDFLSILTSVTIGYQRYRKGSRLCCCGTSVFSVSKDSGLKQYSRKKKKEKKKSCIFVINCIYQIKIGA